jgi:hypothetical protein
VRRQPRREQVEVATVERNEQQVNVSVPKTREAVGSRRDALGGPERIPSENVVYRVVKGRPTGGTRDHHSLALHWNRVD